MKSGFAFGKSEFAFLLCESAFWKSRLAFLLCGLQVRQSQPAFPPVRLHFLFSRPLRLFAGTHGAGSCRHFPAAPVLRRSAPLPPAGEAALTGRFDATPGRRPIPSPAPDGRAFSPPATPARQFFYPRSQAGGLGNANVPGGEAPLRGRRPEPPRRPPRPGSTASPAARVPKPPASA